TGGYTKIAVVVSEDVSRLAQVTPGQVVRFRQVSVAEAHAGLRAYEAKFQALQQAWQRRGEGRSYALRTAGRSYQVGVEEGIGTYTVSLEEQAQS
ncbi:MAG: urea amidolyase, partial [Candidatus Methylomirabilis sp.]